MICRLNINIDIQEGIFGTVTEMFDQFRNDESTVKSVKINEFIDIAPSTIEDIEVAIFFARCTSFESEKNTLASRKIRELSTELVSSQQKNKVHKVSLIDFGDIYQQPLSDFSVIGHYIELVMDSIVANVPGGIYTADRQDIDWSFADTKFYDVSSPDFIGRIVNHIETSLEGLSEKFGEKI